MRTPLAPPLHGRLRSVRPPAPPSSPRAAVCTGGGAPHMGPPAAGARFAARRQFSAVRTVARGGGRGSSGRTQATSKGGDQGLAKSENGWGRRLATDRAGLPSVASPPAGWLARRPPPQSRTIAAPCPSESACIPSVAQKQGIRLGYHPAASRALLAGMPTRAALTIPHQEPARKALQFPRLPA